MLLYCVIDISLCHTDHYIFSEEMTEKDASGYFDMIPAPAATGEAPATTATRRLITNTNTAIAALGVIWDVIDYESFTNVEIIGIASICKATREKARYLLSKRKAQSIFPEMWAEMALSSYRHFA